MPLHLPAIARHQTQLWWASSWTSYYLKETSCPRETSCSLAAIHPLYSLVSRATTLREREQEREKETYCTHPKIISNAFHPFFPPPRHLSIQMLSFQHLKCHELQGWVRDVSAHLHSESVNHISSFAEISRDFDNPICKSSSKLQLTFWLIKMREFTCKE
jgi:hypothetical protein